MNKLLILLSISLLALSSCSNGGTSYHYDPPTNPATTSSSPISWNPSSFPLVIYVPAEMNTFQTSINNAGNTWNVALGFKVFNFVFNNDVANSGMSIPNTQWVHKFDSLYDNLFGLYKILDPAWNYENVSSEVLAFTGTIAQNVKITHADLLFNFQNTSFNFGDANDGTAFANQRVDFQSVLTHELGHFLGLNHVSSSEDSLSIMLATINKGTVKRNLSQGDLSRIRVLYNIK